MEKTRVQKGTFVGSLFAKRFQLEDVIGRGSAGVVYRATDLAFDNKKIAVKVLKTDLIEDQEMVARFQAEAAMTQGMSCPHIIEIICYGRTSVKNYFIAMELVEGSNAKDALVRKGDPYANLDRKLEVILATGRALEYAHRFGIIHRDIKPENVLLGFNGAIKLTDFGLARPIHIDRYLSVKGQIVGSAGYMSPEQLRGDKLDGRTDMYSLGIMAYETITGHLPYTANDLQEMYRKHNTEPLPSVCDLTDAPRWVDNLLQKTTAKKREKRFSNMSEWCNFFATNFYKSIMEKRAISPAIFPK